MGHSEYIVIHRKQLVDVINTVNEEIQKGFIPQGGLQVVHRPAGYEFYQAMTKSGIQISANGKEELL